MSFEEDDEILQDFLMEAGEILEQLSEQLVELEQSPEDHDLLNAIFRGFHTVKGGAGFLQLNALVDCCHEAENVFDNLRNGQRKVNAELMDCVLKALDHVHEMFADLRAGNPLEAAPKELLIALNSFSKPAIDDAERVVESGVDIADGQLPSAKSETKSQVSDHDGDITDDEFERLLDALPSPVEGKNQAESSADNKTNDEEATFPEEDDLFGDFNEVSASEPSDEITEDEFEALLDQIHGKGQHNVTAHREPSQNEPILKEGVSSEPQTDIDSNNEHGLITDSEFEDLLDRLHGKGKHTVLPLEDGCQSVGEEDSVSNKGVKPESASSASVSTLPDSSSQSSQFREEASKANRNKTMSPEISNKIDKPLKARKDKKSPQSVDSPTVETTVRVDTKRLDDIMNMVGELVLVRNRLVRLGLNSNDETMSKAVSNLDVVTADLQSSVMKTRMQPIKKVFGRFPRVVRDLARSLKKEINLELRGEDTDLDKNLVEALADPLVHLIRNSVDHGIEMPEQREAKGKSRSGSVVLAAEQEGDHILLTIEDDGAGMDAGVLRRKAVEKGMMDQDAAERLTDHECYNLIFAPGFSTKEKISDVSGRGVGMDVVKTKISQLNGTIHIDSNIGKGTRIEIKVPLTLAIMPTLMVMLKNQAFAFPLVSVNEIFHLDLNKTNVVDGQEMIVVRDKPIPLFHLKRWLIKGNHDASADTQGHVLVVSIGNQRAGFVVDKLIGQEEVVIKPLGAMLHGTAGMAGATITGDGRIALILDVPSMLQHYAGHNLSAA